MRTLALILFSAACVFSQTPPIEPGVSQELAKWRASRYSDVRYKLNLTLEKMSPVLKGTMEIRVKVGAGTLLSPAPQGVSIPPIILDWRKIKGHEGKSTISNITVNGRPNGGHQDGVSAVGDRSVPAPIEQNEHLIFRDGVIIGENIIKLDFTSPILTSGSAITRYVDKEDGAEYIYSLFVPSDASTAFPVFDQPDLKAKFSLQLVAQNDWKLVSNTAITGHVQANCGQPSTINIETGSATNIATGEAAILPFKGCDPITSFAETKPISTYVFAFAAGPFERVSVPPALASGTMPVTAKASDTDPTKTRKVKPELKEAYKRWLSMRADPETSIYVRKSQAEKFKPHAAEVFRLNREAVKYFEEYFDYKFPFPKYDLVLIPEFPFGGMEHAGATFLRESAIIFPQEPTKNDHISRAVLIFHEAAHQWFGDTVTMRWFDDLWLKEGFANFAAYKAMERIMPEANAWKVFYERIKQGAYQTDSTKGTTPIYQEIKNLSAAKSAYGNIVYNKAPAFLRQAEFYLGEDKFQTAVRSFLKKHEFKNAGWQDLIREFETAGSKVYLKDFANKWVTQRGLPVIKIEYAGGASEWTDRGHTSRSMLSATFRSLPNEDVFWLMNVNGLIRYSESLPDSSLKDGSRTEVLELGPSVSYNEPKPKIKNAFTELIGVKTLASRGSTVDFVFPNYGDYGYGIFLLDDKSRDYVLKNIQNEKDPFLRAMMWGSLWDSVREGELDARDYVDLVVKVLSTAPRKSTTPSTEAASTPPIQEGNPEDESTIATLLNRTSTALNYYLGEAERVGSPHVSKGSAAGVDPSLTVGLRTRVENMVLERMYKATTLGERITFYRAFLNLAASDNARRVLKELLNEARGLNADGTKIRNVKPEIKEVYRSATAPAIPFKVKDKFDIVTRLLILGDPDAERLLAELEKTETTDEAKRYAYAARAGIATAENKAKYWNDFVNNKEISESWIEAAFGPFNSIRHHALTLPYLQKALQELPNHKRSRKIFFVNGWLGAFIGGQRSDEALAIVNKFLIDNPNLDKDLRLKILENVDVIERAVKIRAKYGKN